MIQNCKYNDVQIRKGSRTVIRFERKKNFLQRLWNIVTTDLTFCIGVNRHPFGIGPLTVINSNVCWNSSHQVCLLRKVKEFNSEKYDEQITYLPTIFWLDDCFAWYHSYHFEDIALIYLFQHRLIFSIIQPLVVQIEVIAWSNSASSASSLWRDQQVSLHFLTSLVEWLNSFTLMIEPWFSES